MSLNTMQFGSFYPVLQTMNDLAPTDYERNFARNCKAAEDVALDDEALLFGNP